MHQSEGKNFPSTSNLLYFSYIIKGSTKRLKKCIAEVTNAPWGERVSFVFDPHSDLVAKALHVCPFMVANYAFFFTAFRGQEIMVHKNYYLFYFIVFYPD
ncbi:hypothetical protein GLYMA_08G293333v4 [Glycine max]|nr:hypothetical protein GLYMA_08G293333v4 [Glycine max]KAH1053715.1 hypothetical protein GYH30_022791 [Glycine max]